MRLIDADSIYITIEGGRRNGKHELSDAIEKAINKAFQEATPVEAIPISWLEDFRDGLDTLSESKLMGAIDLIIDAYRVEKKRNDEMETWHSLKGDIKAPRGTFDKIYEDDEV